MNEMEDKAAAATAETEREGDAARTTMPEDPEALCPDPGSRPVSPLCLYKGEEVGANGPYALRQTSLRTRSGHPENAASSSEQNPRRPSRLPLYKGEPLGDTNRALTWARLFTPEQKSGGYAISTETDVRSGSVERGNEDAA
jgi:hypothetical protein